MKSLKKFIGILFIFIFVILSIRYFQPNELWLKSKAFFVEHPFLIIIVSIAYTLSFVFRALAWKLYLSSEVKFWNCLKGILFSLTVNHIAPFKIGDIIRIGYLSRQEKHVTIDESAHSVVVLRALDMLVLLIFSFLGLIYFSKLTPIHISVWLLPVCGLLLAFVFLLWKWKPDFLNKHWQLFHKALLSRNFVFIFLLVILSWCLEGAVIWGVTTSLKEPILLLQAIWVNSVTVGGQIFQVTPGGISTYESMMTFTLISIQYPNNVAYYVAIISHGYKFIFSYAVGILLVIKSPIYTIKQIKELLLVRGEMK
ncbi:hypothetical protein SAMN04488577_1558 [Bacillus sp. cl95]|nr:hypothetical protein SAMN02799634_10782 [Bacillus sp. UNCCL13]SFQ77794.1 hypothetical protein SAMN04488577_1558 [Bacillus sp. cl95]